MKQIRLMHKIYGGLQLIRVCRDWPKWLGEYFWGAKDQKIDSFKMRCGATLYTRHNGSDFHMIDEIWVYQKYDYFGYRVRPGDIVVDIGANIGTFSLYAATVCNAAQVFSFEPFADNFKMLTYNVDLNRVQTVKCVNQAVAGSPGKRTLKLNPFDPGSHSLMSNSSEDVVEVDCCTLGDIFERFSLKKIDYLKIDCEGAEYEILESGASRLGQIDRISMETHTIPERNAEDMERLLTSHKFKVKLFEGHRLYATRQA